MSQTRSLQRDLIVRLTVGLSLLSVTLAAGVYGFVHYRFRHQFDDALAAKARALASLVQEQKAGHLEFEFADELMPEFGHTTAVQYFQVWRADGRTLEKSDSLSAANLPKFAGTLQQPKFRDYQLETSGTLVRAAGIQFHPELSDEEEHALEAGERKRPDPVTVVVARATQQLNSTLLLLAICCAGGAVLLPLCAALLVGFTVRRGLQPVWELSREVTLMGSESLDRRVDVPTIPTELLPVQAGINDLLERLSNAFARERRFTSSVSHELKTPLAEALTALSVAQRWPRDEALQAKSTGDAIEALRRMRTLTETLFALTRSDTLVGAEQDEVDLVQLIDKAIAPYVELAKQRELMLVTGIEADGVLQITAPAALLRSVLNNIVNNAVTYAPANSTITLNVTRKNGNVRITCSNSAPELTGAEVARLAEPFWRQDSSRTDSQHCGLGLTIAQSFCKAMGGELQIYLEGQTLKVQVELPTCTKETEVPLASFG